ncbi:hypothetical protein NM688_g9068 [Phlebia brevispora]|uniref:Uncharacterized protein n=1 Tax=Phlebia brevispora TaxID=194682 RepID=A0ACC1RJR1_9APHY|nr:hypothetical protein NM688_g9068 [Phlebia brevispora]
MGLLPPGGPRTARPSQLPREQMQSLFHAINARPIVCITSITSAYSQLGTKFNVHSLALQAGARVAEQHVVPPR